MDSEKSLVKIRKEIDDIDFSICTLLSRRIDLSVLAKTYKLNIVDKNREREVIKNVSTFGDSVKKIYRKIINECRKAQL